MPVVNKKPLLVDEFIDGDWSCVYNFSEPNRGGDVFVDIVLEPNRGGDVFVDIVLDILKEDKKCQQLIKRKYSME